jgi:hypothetical protein
VCPTCHAMQVERVNITRVPGDAPSRQRTPLPERVFCPRFQLIILPRELQAAPQFVR